MNLPEISLKNSVLVNLVSVFVLVVGLFAMSNIRREAFPQVSYDQVIVTTVYPGAPTEDVEKFVTIPLEKEIKAVSGIEEMASKSDEGLSTISIKIDPKEKDKRKVVNDIEQAVERAEDLPLEAEDPLVEEIVSKEFPVIEMSLSGNVSEEERRKYAEALENLIEDIPGVAQVRRYGWRDPEFWVEVDPVKLNQYHVSIQEMMSALRSQNVTLPGGQLTTDLQEYNIRTTGEFKTPQEIEDVIIRSNDSGVWLKVKDVATVKYAFEDEVNIAKINGQRATAMVVVKKEQADAIKVVDHIKETVEQFKKSLPSGTEITFSNDFSYYVKRRLGVLQSNGVFGFFLVLIILFLFMDPIPAFWTAWGIPMAFFMTFAVMALFGITINLVSMLGLIIVLGMLVDDGIVISENIYRYLEEGVPVRQAVIQGASEVIGPVLGTITTTFASFAPLLFMTDIIGKFIKEIPIIVIVALTASVTEAFIMLPSHLYDSISHFKMKPKKEEKKWYVQFKAWYKDVLSQSLNRRYWVMWGLIGCFVFSLWVAKTQMKFILFAGEGIEYFYIRAEAPKGTPLEKTAELLKPVEKIIANLPQNLLDNYRTYVGAIELERGFDPNAKRGSHLAQITVFLTPLQKRKDTPQDIVNRMRSELDKVPGFDKLYTYLPREGPPTGAPVEIGVKGEDFAVMNPIANQIKSFLEGKKGVSDIASSYDYGKKQLKVVVNEEKAKKYGLTIQDIASSVRNVFKGGVATTVKPQKAEKEIDVVVRYPEADRKKMEIFDQVSIPNNKGFLIPLKSVANIEEKEGIYVINHLEGKRVIFVTAQVDNKNTTSLQVNQEIKKAFEDVGEKYLGYSLIFKGEFEEQIKTFRNLLISFGLACFVIFIILVAEFRSLVQPFIVMIAIPFGIIGVILSFWVHDMFTPTGRPLNFFALMGLVGLTGVVVNDSIVLVDFINRARLEGKERRESILQAGVIRLRPILMTSITTIGGLISVAYGIGGGDPFLKPMALAIVWGMVFSTALTLIGIPCLYAIIDDIHLKFLHTSTVKPKEAV